jgi:hypothetical protein
VPSQHRSHSLLPPSTLQADSTVQVSPQVVPTFPRRCLPSLFSRSRILSLCFLCAFGVSINTNPNLEQNNSEPEQSSIHTLTLLRYLPTTILLAPSLLYLVAAHQHTLLCTSHHVPSPYPGMTYPAAIKDHTTAHPHTAHITPPATPLYPPLTRLKLPSLTPAF